MTETQLRRDSLKKSLAALRMSLENKPTPDQRADILRRIAGRSRVLKRLDKEHKERKFIQKMRRQGQL